MSGRAPDLRRLQAIAGSLVDGRVGIVRYVEELPREAGAPDFFHFYARACNTKALGQHENFQNTGGASADRALAVGKALGEAVERYCSALFETEDLPLFSRKRAPFRCVDPAEFALYLPAQFEHPGFPWVPFDDATPIRWTPARDALSGEAWHVPAAMVFVPYVFYQGSGDAPIVQPISTGLASHMSPAEAAVSAVTEVIERDAVMIMWQAALSMPQVRVEGLPDELYNLAERFERTGARVTLLNITMDVGVPTIMAVLSSAAAPAPALVFAAAASLDPVVAARKALEELAHTRRYSRRIKDLVPRHVPDPPEHASVVDQINHLNFWADHENAKLAAFVFGSTVRQDLEEIPDLSTGDARQDLETLCTKVADVGQRVLIADVTSPDAAELGFTVVRAVIPGFQPLFMGHVNRALGGRRLWDVPARLGYARRAPESGDNPLPHPYP